MTTVLPPQHVCGASGYGQPGDWCPACDHSNAARYEDLYRQTREALEDAPRFCAQHQAEKDEAPKHFCPACAQQLVLEVANLKYRAFKADYDHDRVHFDGAAYKIDNLKVENRRLRKAIANQQGDDLCWIVDLDAAKALPEGEFLQSCHRYHNQIAHERDVAMGLPTIAQLEASNQTLRNVLSNLVAKLDACRPALDTMATLAHVHGMQYDGPTYSEELAAARPYVHEVVK